MSSNCGLEGIQTESGQICFFKKNRNLKFWRKSPNFLNIGNAVSKF